jgi:hypothetical protein
LLAQAPGTEILFIAPSFFFATILGKHVILIIIIIFLFLHIFLFLLLFVIFGKLDGRGGRPRNLRFFLSPVLSGGPWLFAGQLLLWLVRRRICAAPTPNSPRTSSASIGCYQFLFLLFLLFLLVIVVIGV